FPIAGESRYPVSNGGGVKPTWARNGKELFYLDGTSMMSVAIQTEPSFRAGTPEKLFDGPYFAAIAGPTYDVSASGRFMMIKKPPLDEKATPASMIVAPNWFEELKAQFRK